MAEKSAQKPKQFFTLYLQSESIEKWTLVLSSLSSFQSGTSACEKVLPHLGCLPLNLSRDIITGTSDMLLPGVSKPKLTGKINFSHHTLLAFALKQFLVASPHNIWPQRMMDDIQTPHSWSKVIHYFYNWSAGEELSNLTHCREMTRHLYTVQSYTNLQTLGLRR